MLDKTIKEKLNQEIEIPDVVKERVAFTLYDIRLAKFGEEREEKNMKRKTYYRKGIVAAACVFMVSSVTVVTAAVMNWNPKVVEKFHVSEEVQQDLAEKGGALVPELSVECNQTKISMEQCIADNNFLYFLFKITVPEDITITEDIDFGQITLLENGMDDQFNWGGGLLYSENNNSYEIDNETHTFYYEIYGQRISPENYEGSEITISFKDMQNYDIKTDDTKLLVSGDWDFSWSETKVDVMKEYNCTDVLKEGAATVKNIVISPISVNVLYDYPKTPEIIAGLNELDPAAEPPMVTAFEMKDGSTVEVMTGMGTMGYVSDESNEFRSCSMIENTIVNPEEIVAVYFEGERVALD